MDVSLGGISGGAEPPSGVFSSTFGCPQLFGVGGRVPGASFKGGLRMEP